GIEEAPSLTDEFQQPPAGAVILRVRLEMFREVVDALAQDGDLSFRRSGVLSVGLVAADDVGLAVLGQCQINLHARLRPRRWASSHRAAVTYRWLLRVLTVGKVSGIPNDSTSYIRTMTGCKSPPGSSSAIPTSCPAPSRSRTRAVNGSSESCADGGSRLPWSARRTPSSVSTTEGMSGSSRSRGMSLSAAA